MKKILYLPLMDDFIVIVAINKQGYAASIVCFPPLANNIFVMYFIGYRPHVKRWGGAQSGVSSVSGYFFLTDTFKLLLPSFSPEDGNTSGCQNFVLFSNYYKMDKVHQPRNFK
jgi:hypothetical protein